MLERPELRRQTRAARLEQRRQVDVVGAEAHAVLAQGGARRLIEPLDLLGHLLALEHAERFDELEGDTARDAGHVVGDGEREQRLEQPSRYGS